MATLPYVTSPGNIEKAMNGIKAAAVPDRVGQDFVKTMLKIPGGSGDQMTAFLKKIGFAASDAKPTDIYTKFRNPSSSGAATARALKHGYSQLFARNEYWPSLSDDDLLGLIVEETGQPHDSNPVKLTLNCLKSLKSYADFNSSALDTSQEQISIAKESESSRGYSQYRERSMGLNIGYTINLNLPATSGPSVFNAIFKSLKEHLLSEDDA